MRLADRCQRSFEGGSTVLGTVLRTVLGTVRGGTSATGLGQNVRGHQYPHQSIIARLSAQLMALHPADGADLRGAP
jgi:hypothetical protein